MYSVCMDLVFANGAEFVHNFQTCKFINLLEIYEKKFFWSDVNKRQFLCVENAKILHEFFFVTKI